MDCFPPLHIICRYNMDLVPTYRPPSRAVGRASFWVAGVIGAGAFVIIVIIALAAGLRHSRS